MSSKVRGMVKVHKRRPEMARLVMKMFWVVNSTWVSDYDINISVLAFGIYQLPQPNSNPT
jgi:hypothetical protein